MGENMNIPDEYLPRVGAGREELITFYSWEFEDAKKAQNEWDKADHQPSGRGPFFRWVAAIELIELAEQFKETEDKRVLLQAISICALNDFAIPQWCASSYIKSFRDAWHYRVKSWDEAFGPLNPPYTQVETRRKERKVPLEVYLRVTEIKNNDPRIPLDGALFERVGKELGICETTANDYWRSVKKIMSNSANSPIEELSTNYWSPYISNKE